MQKTVTLIPKDIVLNAYGKDVPLSDIIIQKNLHDAGSVRLGGLVRGNVIKPSWEFLSLRAGLLAETGATPIEKQTVDSPNWQRISLNFGVGASFGRYEVAAAYGHFFQPELYVSPEQSQAQQTVAFSKTVTPTIVGAGTYNSSADMLGLMVSASFL